MNHTTPRPRWLRRALAGLLALAVTATLCGLPHANAQGKGKPGGGGDGGGGGGGGGGTAPASSITFLETLGGASITIEGINRHGEVVGHSDTAVISGRSWRHAFLNVGGGGRVTIDLQDLFEDEGLIPPFDYDAQTGLVVNTAGDINDAGQICGRMIFWNAGKPTEAGRFRYTPATVDENGDPVAAELDTTGSGPSDQERPTAINAHADVAASAHDSAGLLRAVVWVPAGPVIDLGLMGGRQTRARDINDSGQVCGDNNGLAWRFTAGVGYEDLGTLFPKAKETSNWSSSINNSGQVAGNCQDWNRKGLNLTITQRGFRYTDGPGMLNLGTLGGDTTRAESLNNFGDVVGISKTSGGQLHVFLYTDALGMVDLEASIINLNSASLHGTNGAGRVLINDVGQVAGNASGGQAYILTPLE